MKHIASCLVALLAAAAPVFGAPSNYHSHDAIQPAKRAIEDYPVDAPSKSSCDPADFMAEQVPFGNNEGGGGFFCAAKWRDGVLPRRIEARADVRTLRWLKISFTDGSEIEHGQHIALDSAGRGGIVEWDPYTQSFSKFQIAGGGWNGGVGRLVAEIAGMHMDVGGYNMRELSDVPRGNGGDGVLLGFEVRAGDGIDYIRPMFAISRIEKVKMVEGTFEPTYEQLNEKPYSERQMRAIHATHHFDNTESSSGGTLIIDASMTTEEGVAVSEVKENGTDVSNEWGIGVSGEVSWEVGLPVIGGAGSKVNPETHYKYSKSVIEKKASSIADSQGWSTTVRYRSEHEVKPNSAVTCNVVILQSHVNLTFTSILQWIFKDGQTHNFKVHGRMTNAEHSEAFTTCVDKKPGDVKGDDFWDLSAQVADDKAQTMNQFELDPATFIEITSTDCGSEGSHFCPA